MCYNSTCFHIKLFFWPCSTVFYFACIFATDCQIKTYTFICRGLFFFTLLINPLVCLLGFILLHFTLKMQSILMCSIPNNAGPPPSTMKTLHNLCLFLCLIVILHALEQCLFYYMFIIWLFFVSSKLFHCCLGKSMLTIFRAIKLLSLPVSTLRSILLFCLLLVLNFVIIFDIVLLKLKDLTVTTFVFIHLVILLFSVSFITPFAPHVPVLPFTLLVCFFMHFWKCSWHCLLCQCYHMSFHMLDTVLPGMMSPTSAFPHICLGNWILCFGAFCSYSVFCVDLSIILSSLLSFRLSNIIFCDHCISILFTHDKMYSIMYHLWIYHLAFYPIPYFYFLYPWLSAFPSILLPIHLNALLVYNIAAIILSLILCIEFLLMCIKQSLYSLTCFLLYHH